MTNDGHIIVAPRIKEDKNTFHTAIMIHPSVDHSTCKNSKKTGNNMTGQFEDEKK